MQPPNIWFGLGCFSAAAAVAAGAFGAHGLKNLLTPEMLAIFETAVRYQMYHAFGLIATGTAGWFLPGLNIKWAGWCFTLGTILFSGSLYVLTLTGILWLGAVTPFGGVAFIAGWLVLGILAIRNRPR